MFRKSNKLRPGVTSLPLGTRSDALWIIHTAAPVDAQWVPHLFFCTISEHFRPSPTCSVSSALCFANTAFLLDSSPSAQENHVIFNALGLGSSFLRLGPEDAVPAVAAHVCKACSCLTGECVRFRRRTQNPATARSQTGNGSGF